MRLSKLLEGIQYTQMISDVTFDCEIVGLYTDSRQSMPNGMFICLDGEKTDSHLCVNEAVQNGAVVVVAERKTSATVPQIIVPDTREAVGLIAATFYQNPSRDMKIVGVTGTNGKTTTSYMLAEIWKQSGRKVGVIGTLGVSYANKKIKTDLTTPDPIFLQKTLSDMRSCGVEYVVMEVSAHALYYKKTAGIRFTACVFTNLTQDHLDFFDGMDAYKAAKLRLFTAENCPLAIVNGDDKTGREIGELREKHGLKTVYYGIETPTDAFAVITDESLYSTECVLNLEDKLCRISLAMIGRHNVYNALAAAMSAVATDCELSDISQGIASLKSVDGRLQRIGELRGAEIYVDFAHTPDGIGKSLDALKKHCKGRLICVFGCGGNRDKTKRPVMGETVAKKADFSVLTSDNPRYEDPLDIISGIEKGYRRFSVRYVVVPDRQVALDYALDFVKKNDVLLVAGKGGEDYQEIMGIKHLFNDHTVLSKLMAQKSKKISD